MIAPFNCPDIVEPGYEEWVEDDLDSLYATPAVGTDWRALPPDDFVEALFGAPPEEQAELMRAAFRGDADYGRFACFFPDLPDSWYGRSDTASASNESVMWRALHGAGILLLKDPDSPAVRHYIGREPGQTAERMPVDVPCCAGAVPSYRTVLTRCEVADAG